MGIVHTLTKTLTASPVSLDTARQVLFTPAGDEAGNGTIWTVYGTNGSNNAIQEAVTGVASPSTVATSQNFKTVTRIAVNKAQAGAVTIGTNGVGSTDWQSVDMMREPINIGFSVIVTGTVNYTIQITNQDVNSLAVGAYPTTSDLAQFTTLTYSTSGGITTPIAYFRLQINSGTGSCQLVYEQAGP